MPLRSLLVFLALTLLPPPAFPQDKDEVEDKRSEQGFVVRKGSYVAIPDDMKMERVAKNVIKPESTEAYLGRKLESLEKMLEEKLAGLDSKWDERFAKIEERLKQIDKKYGKETKRSPLLKEGLPYKEPP